MNNVNNNNINNANNIFTITHIIIQNKKSY